MKKRVLSLALAALMLLALLPTGAFADYTQEPAQTGWDDPTGNSTTENAQMFRLLPTDITADPPTTLRQAELFEYWEDSEWTLEQSKESVFQEIVTMVENLTKGKATETEKAEAIFYWVTYNIDYDEACYTTGRTWQMGNAFYTFARRKGVCEGYARLSTLMMTIAGLPTAYIGGDARSGGLHAWNAVLADGRWIMFDATWHEWDISADYHNKMNGLTWRVDGCKISIDDSMKVAMSGFVDKENCPSDFVIPDSVERVSRSAFYECTGLTSITIPGSVTQIESYAFHKCSNLTSVAIPNSVTSIENFAFYGCALLESVTIPNSVTSIEYGTFRDCTSLESVVLPNSVTSIEDLAFCGCTSLTSVTIPDSVTIIGYGTFSHCEKLKLLTIPDSVTIIGYCAFSDCNSLTDVYYGGSEEQWQAIMMGGHNAPLTRAKIHYNPAAGTAPTAYASTQNVRVDGKKVEFPCYALKDANGNDTNYVKLRDVASVLSGTGVQFDVGWNGAVNIETGKAYTPNGSEMSTPFSGDRIYKKASSGTKFNGFSVSLDAIVLTDDAGNGYTYYKLRDLGAWLGFTVDWSAEKGIFIETK